MILSFKLLQNYLDISATKFLQLEKDLWNWGYEVNSVSNNYYNDKIIVGFIEKIIKNEKYPNLSICYVNINKNQNLQIVCKAKNVSENTYVIVALPGAFINDLLIEKRNICAYESHGMICSLSEINANPKFFSAKDFEGIYIFKDPQIIGKSALELLNLNDILINITVLNNMHIFSSVYWLAKKIAKEYCLKLKPYKLKKIQNSEIKNNFKFINKIPNVCNNLGWIIIKNIEISESPKWLKNALQILNIRSHNYVVDLTNLIAAELNQPLHAYDYDVIDVDIILDKITKTKECDFLSDISLNINNSYVALTKNKENVKIQQLLGILGSKSASITNNTKNILLEAGNFNPKIIRETSQKYLINTESSKIFSNFLPENRITFAIKRFLYLLKLRNLNLKFSPINYLRKIKYKPWFCKLNLNEIQNLYNLNLSKKEIFLCLLQEFPKSKLINDNYAKIEISNFDINITSKNDVIETLFKKNKIFYSFNDEKYCNWTIQKVKNNNINNNNLFQNYNDNSIYQLKLLLVNLGLNEIISPSLQDNIDFYNDIKSILWYDFSNYCIIKNNLNNINRNTLFMRSCMFINLINIVMNNLLSKIDKMFVFEISNIYLEKNNLIEKQKHLSIVISNILFDDLLIENVDKALLNKLNKILFHVYNFFNIDLNLISLKLVQIPNNYLNPHNSYYIIYNKEKIGLLFQVNKHFLIKKKIKNKIYCCEINLSSFEFKNFLALNKLNVKHKKFLDIPFIYRDITFSCLSKKWIFYKDIVINEAYNFFKAMDFKITFLNNYKYDENCAITFALIFQNLIETVSNDVIDNSINDFKKYITSNYNIINK